VGQLWLDAAKAFGRGRTRYERPVFRDYCIKLMLIFGDYLKM